MSRKFKVLGNNHAHHDGKVYKKGETVIVEDDEDLAKQFKGAFAEIHPEPGTSGFGGITDEQLREELERRMLAAKQAADAKAAAEKAAYDKADARAGGKKPKGAQKTDATALAARGTDVTAQFPAAKTADLVVFQRDSLFHVYEPESSAPLNPTGLKKEDVEKFLNG